MAVSVTRPGEEEALKSTTQATMKPLGALALYHNRRDLLLLLPPLAPPVLPLNQHPPQSRLLLQKSIFSEVSMTILPPLHLRVLELTRPCQPWRL